jgi:hypothetical protein
MSRRYHYVGLEEIRAKVLSHPAGTFIGKATDVLQWVRIAHPEVAQDELLAVTFVVDVDERLAVASRHSERKS